MNLNWDFMLEVLPLYEKAAWITLKLGIGGILLSLVIGLFCSFILYYKVQGLVGITRTYIELSRNTPLLRYFKIMIFFLI